MCVFVFLGGPESFSSLFRRLSQTRNMEEGEEVTFLQLRLCKAPGEGLYWPITFLKMMISLVSYFVDFRAITHGV